MVSSCLHVRWTLDAGKSAYSDRSSSMSSCNHCKDWDRDEAKMSLAGSSAETPSISFLARCRAFWWAR